MGKTKALRVLIVAAAMAFWPALNVAAQQATSTNYSVGEVFFGTGGQLNACSTTYCAKQSAGETAVGNTSSTNYQAQGGFTTNREPSLTFIVNSSSTDLGVLSTATTATTTGTFSVLTYLASGYVVVTASAPPSYGGHQFATPSSPTAATTGTEQFGINLVANNSCGGSLPGSLGANPIQVPSSSFSYGAAATGYSTACQFKYAQGDTIAQSTKSSGETDYTISYIFNVSNLTPAGKYSFNHVLVATSTY